jgi:outer membrane lipopolysaccharide assembly protein LptE/RlpB
MIKKFTIVIALIILTGCGFTPMHSKKNNNNFSIEQINFSGERELNNFLKIGLTRYKSSSDKKFFIDVESEFSKIILTKDKTGKATNYELIANVTFKLKSNKKIEFAERKIIKNLNDNFEQTKQERSVKQIFATSMINKLINQLSIIQ